MPRLEWSDRLALGLDAMDETHQEFVELLAAVEAADDAALLPAWQALVAHTQEHFDREDAWMRATGFAPNNCHSMQHAVVLQVMREGLLARAEDRLAAVRHMAQELAPWFVQHAQTMDAALALHLRSVDFDPACGTVRLPQALPAAPVTGCGSAACSPA
ncbi:hemerythrin domain-containing protein [Pseudorhodoferax sp.]|uniref:hemerythrin domain-containing protein n=1 Tax=Pseudorhodoferax sp. TaxID=1993553 RepID=UPI0039E6CB05